MTWGYSPLPKRGLDGLRLPPDQTLVVLAGRVTAASIPVSILSERERERLERFRFREDRERFIVAHGLKRRVCSALSGLPPSLLDFAETEHGKPFLPEGAFHFNLSHSGDWVGLVFHASDPVGIDVEQPRGKFDEQTEMLVFHPGDRIEGRSADRFYAAWTLKEAVSKSAGLGLALPFPELRLEMETGGIGKGIYGRDIWQVKHGVLENGAHLAIAGRNCVANVRTVLVDG